MSRQATIIIRDDYDATLLADETAEIIYEGVKYTIDCTTEHKAELDRDLKRHLDAAHSKERLPRRRQTASADHSAGRRGIANQQLAIPDPNLRKAIRAWAIASGYQVGKTGTLRKEIVDAYHLTQEGISA